MGTATAGERVLEARGLAKHYGKVTAVAGVDLTLGRGECLALLGPNGAGKTTTVEMLEGLTPPDAGTVSLLGRPLGTERRALMQRVGVLLQETNLYKRYTVTETLTLFASFFDKALSPETIMDRLALTEKRDAQLRTLSGGQKQRVNLGCALINDPELMFLDEPTTGLDPQARRAIWDLLGALKAEGKSILLTTHYMEEAEVLADRVAIMDHGKVIAEGSPRQLIREATGEQVLHVAFGSGQGTTPGAKAQQGFRDLVATRLPWLADARVTDDGLEAPMTDATAQLQELVAVVPALGLTLVALEVRRGTLEDVFLKLTGRSMRDG